MCQAGIERTLNCGAEPSLNPKRSVNNQENATMTIKVGDKVPDAKFMTMGPDGPKALSTAEIFAGKKVALFAVPGAYTPTCHMQHMPGFVARVDEIKKKGIDTIACTAVNDVFVMDSWANDTGATGKIVMLTDDSAAFAKAIGLDIDLTGAGIGLGVRSKRYAMLVDNGVVKMLNVDESPPSHDKSSAETLCSMIDSSI
jgi:glutaredoxin/glutathione-dependent peroxiredoxin